MLHFKFGAVCGFVMTNKNKSVDFESAGGVL